MNGLMFSRLVDELLGWPSPRGETVWAPYTPPIDIQHDDEGATLSVDMPGLGPDDVDVSFESGMLAISGKRGDRSYAYRVTLGDAFDADAIEAKLDRGVLTVRARKRPDAKPRRIAINGRMKQGALGSGEA